MTLRVLHQAEYLGFTEKGALDTFKASVLSLTLTRINPQIPAGHPRVGRLSPLGSVSLGASLLRILAFDAKLRSTESLDFDRIHFQDIISLSDAVELACDQGEVRGGDEVLYGRAGLLHAILNIRELSLDEDYLKSFSPVFARIPDLINAIISTGRLAAQDYLEIHGEREALPLMWPWHDKHYIGASVKLFEPT